MPQKIIEKNGLKLEVNTNRNSLRFKVLEQTEEASKILDFLRYIEDDETGFSLKSNLRPSFSKTKKRFFVRGIQKEFDEKETNVKFDTIEQCQEAVNALERMVNTVEKPPHIKDLKRKMGTLDVKGGTAHARFHFINRKMARFLGLTDAELYPENYIKWKPTAAVVTDNKHYNEHIQQIIDVLNKTTENPKSIGTVVNQHRVTPKQAIAARDLVREGFKKAEEQDCLVAFWRILSGLRSLDDQ